MKKKLLEMTTHPNQPVRDRNSDFGLPRRTQGRRPNNGGGSGLGVALIILTLMLIIGGGVAYWLLNSSNSELLKELNLAQDVPTTTTEEEPIALEKYEVIEEEADKTTPPPPPYRPARGSLSRVTLPQGRYYVIANSFIDDDLAADYAEKLVKQGAEVSILTPLRSESFFRVAVGQADTLYEANRQVQELRGTYGRNIWVKKY